MGDNSRSKERKSQKVSSSLKSKMPIPLLERATKNLAGIFACSLLVFDSVLVFFIIAYVPYTKIDWDAYMSQVSEFLNGERDYSNIEGDTGPLVYPAGFLYVYSAIQYITGGQVHPAQIFFGALYIINLAIVFFIYIKTDALFGGGRGRKGIDKTIQGTAFWIKFLRAQA